MKISLIVTDAGPLITLAMARALDTLLLLNVPVIVPDMVEYEVVTHADKPGAHEVMDWLEQHRDRVEIGETEVFDEFLALLALRPDLRSRGRGEQAAGEILARELLAKVDAAILLFEDSALRKTNFLRRMPDNVLLMSTSAYLRGLQRRGLLEDADAILQRAVAVRGSEVALEELRATAGAEDAKRRWLSRPPPVSVS
jgi:hypothetical protein